MSNVAALRRAAEAGDREAQFQLAEILLDSELLDPQARDWCKRAALQAHAPACMRMCEIEIEYGGVGGEREGVMWYRRARELGHPHELSALGVPEPLVKEIFPIPFTVDESRSWLIKFAQAGDFRSQAELGFAYAYGTLGLLVDIPQAYAWLATSTRTPPGCSARFQTDVYGIDDYGTPERGVRMLEHVMNEQEKTKAFALAKRLMAECGSQNEQLIKRLRRRHVWAELRARVHSWTGI